jgi:hypothetical protein
MDLNKTLEYVDFLISEIEDYNQDWTIEFPEIQKFLIEFEKFKKLTQSSIDIPYEIREKILKISFSYNPFWMKFKATMRYLIYLDASAYRMNQIDGKRLMEGYLNQLLILHREIDSYMYKHKISV